MTEAEQKARELFGCPFCGREPTLKFSHEAGCWVIYEVECEPCNITKWSDCGFEGDAAKASAITAWNTRALAMREEVMEVLRFYAGEWYQDQWENSGERRPSEWIDSVSVNPTRELYADRGERARTLLASIERGDG